MEVLLFWGFGLLAAAVLLQLVDIFVPTAGVLTVTAVVIALAGVVCLWAHSATFGLIGTMLMAVGGPVIFFVGLNLMPQTPLGRTLVLGVDEEAGATETETAASITRLQQLVGSEGKVVSDLRPIGIISVGGERYEAFAESAMIRAGSAVRVVGVVDGTSLRVSAA
ncbi:hypothetical protein BH11PLA1_BH11PLA1_07360 [soil metagenome]